MAGQIDKDKDKEIDLLRLELAAMTRDRDDYRVKVSHFSEVVSKERDARQQAERQRDEALLAGLRVADCLIASDGQLTQAEQERDALKAVHEEWRTQWQDAVRLRDGACVERDAAVANAEMLLIERERSDMYRLGLREGAKQAEATTRRLRETLGAASRELHDIACRDKCELDISLAVEGVAEDLDAALAGTGITKAELEFLQAKAEGTLPANASWADWKASWTERKA